MEIIGANEGKKRRLPSWMMMGNVGSKESKDDGVGTINPGGVGSQVSVPKVKTKPRKNVRKNLREDEETCVTEEVSAPKTKKRSRKIVNESLDEYDEVRDSEEVNASKLERLSKRGQKETLNEDEETNTDGSCILVKCDTTERQRKISSEVEDSDVNSVGNEQLDQIAVPRKTKKGKVNKLTTKEVSSSCAYGGRELRMEELISIAEEYMKAESLTEQQQQTVGARGPEEKLSAADPSFDGARTECLLAATEVKYTSPSSCDQMQNSSIFSNLSSTGDAAQDMLNLLLGPLLVKPVEESTATLNRDDMFFDRPVRNQSKNDIVEELAPPLKKKTSLKDKVAMFFESD